MLAALRTLPSATAPSSRASSRASSRHATAARARLPLELVNPLLLLLTYTLVFTSSAEPRPRHRSPTRCSCSAASCPGPGFRPRSPRRPASSSRRPPDQEGALPGRGAAGRVASREPRPLPAGAAGPARLPARTAGSPGWRSRCRCRCSCSSFSARSRAVALGPHRALPRHPEHPRPRAAPLVLRDADPLPLRRDARGAAAAPRAAPQPDDARGRRLPGDPLLRPRRPLARALAWRCWSAVVAFALGAWLFDRLRDTLAEEV